jgi:hypothetical protein
MLLEDLESLEGFALLKGIFLEPYKGGSSGSGSSSSSGSGGGKGSSSRKIQRDRPASPYLPIFAIFVVLYAFTFIYLTSSKTK